MYQIKKKLIYNAAIAGGVNGIITNSKALVMQKKVVSSKRDNAEKHEWFRLRTKYIQ